MGALQFLKYRNFTLPWNQRDRMKFRNVVHYLIGKGIVIALTYWLVFFFNWLSL